jgi:predicted molibdopterin-dependent oxidoreductase YjgC
VTEDITGAIADSMNYTIDELRALVTGVNNASTQVSAKSQQAQAVSVQLLDAAEKQSREIQSTTEQVLGVANTLSSVSTNAEESSKVAMRSLAAADKGRLAVQNSISGISWDRLNRESSVTYPCADDNDPGQPVVFIDKVPTASGRAKFVPADIIPANERPDTEFPFVLITGRQLEHWHTGSMTRRASVLDAIEPGAMVSMNPMDMRKVGVAAGETVTIASRRGHVGIAVRADEGIPVGSVFMPFAYYEAAANMLTNPALDPFGKIAELKYCAVNVTKGAEMVELSSYGGGMAFTDASTKADAGA